MLLLEFFGRFAEEVWQEEDEKGFDKESQGMNKAVVGAVDLD